MNKRNQQSPADSIAAARLALFFCLICAAVLLAKGDWKGAGILATTAGLFWLAIPVTH